MLCRAATLGRTIERTKVACSANFSTHATFPRTSYPFAAELVCLEEAFERGTYVNFVTEEQLADQCDLPELLKADFKASAGAVAVSYSDDERVVTVGLGPEKKVDANGLRAATAACIHHLRSMGIDSAAIQVPHNGVESVGTHRTMELVAQTAMLSNYRFDKYLTGKQVTKNEPLQSIDLVWAGERDDAIEATVSAAKASVSATWLARDVANERGDVMDPAEMESVCKDMAARHGLKMKVIDADELQQLGHNLHYAVGKGAAIPPRLVVLEYHGADEAEVQMRVVNECSE
jgi:leucyl aminopeptidase